MTEQDRLMHALFEHPGRTHVDIKFLRGTGANVSSEDVCREATNAIFQIDHGKVDGDEAFLETSKRVNVIDLVASL